MHEDEESRHDPSSSPTTEQPERSSFRPRHCWEIVRQIPGLTYHCEECYAYFVQQDCWTLWALRRPGFKPCCQKKGDCAECVVLGERMRPGAEERLEITRKQPMRPPPAPSKRICTYLQLYSSGVLVEGDGREPAVMRALQMRNADFRCRLRGVHLDMSYVNDVCVSRNVDECVFLDEPSPEIRIRPLPMLNQSQATDVKNAPRKLGGLPTGPAPINTPRSER